MRDTIFNTFTFVVVRNGGGEIRLSAADFIGDTSSRVILIRTSREADGLLHETK